MESGYSDIAWLSVSLMYAAELDGIASKDIRPSARLGCTGGTLNSVGVLSEVLSTVIERPWVRGGV